MTIHIGPRTISAIGGSIKRVGNYRIHTFPSELVTDGLVLNLDAGDPRSYPGSGTSWTDLSGNGNTGTLVNSPTYNNANGGLLTFNGTNTRVSVPNSTSTSSFTNQLTVSIICSSTYPDGGYRCPLMKATNNSWTDGFGFYQVSGTFYFYINTFNGAQTVSTNISSFGLTHWTATYDGQRIRLYQNGSLVTTGSSFTSNITNSSQSLFIGDGAGSIYPWAGNILAVQIYNRGLSTAEVAQNYDALRVRYASYTNTFTPLCGGASGRVEVLCVAGGGGGGYCLLGDGGGGGGGAGGLIYNSAFPVSSNNQQQVTVGSGGIGSTTTNGTVNGSNGSNSTFNSLTAIGGGGGGSTRNSSTLNVGGSGGGAGSDIGDNTGGFGTSGQGNNGGSNTTGSVGAGGGGAGENGVSVSVGTDTPNGGNGLSYSITGTSTYYAGGGGGGKYSGGSGNAGTGGLGGGGNGGKSAAGSNGIPNTGGGGGGGGMQSAVTGNPGGNGSNGIVIVRYPATDYNVELLIVGGGASGGSGSLYAYSGGGGGAGGLLYYSSYSVSAGTKYTVTVGKGGGAVGGGYNNTTEGLDGVQGGNSQFSSQIAFGGGAGAGGLIRNGLPGGSGGGGGGRGSVGGSGVSGQGNAGGGSGNFGDVTTRGGGGGGAGSAGTTGDTTINGLGGSGLTFSISGSSVTYAEGGHSGYASQSAPSANTGSGGKGGVGNGGYSTAGADGIIIIAYQGPQRGIGGTVDTTSRPGYTLHRFTTTGTDFFIP